MDTPPKINLPLALRNLFPKVNGGVGPMLSRDFHARGDQFAPEGWHPRWTLAPGESYPEQPTARQLAAALIPPPGPVPTLTARQLRLWLLSVGLTPEMIDAQIAAIPDPAAQARARVEWDYATVYHHNHPLVLQIGAALQMDQLQIDDAFRAGAAL